MGNSTNLEQSRRLMEKGLKAETADSTLDGSGTPSWSFVALLAVVPYSVKGRDNDDYYFEFRKWNDPEEGICYEAGYFDSEGFSPVGMITDESGVHNEDDAISAMVYLVEWLLDEGLVNEEGGKEDGLS